MTRSHPVLVIHPQHRLTAPELLMFGVEGVFSSETELLTAAEQEKHAALVLIPPCPPTKKFWDELFRQSEKRAGIVYAGKEIVNICQEARYCRQKLAIEYAAETDKPGGDEAACPSD